MDTTTCLAEREAAKRCCVTQRTLKRWRKNGAGPPYCRLGPRRIGYRLSELEVWLAARTYRHSADELSRQPGA